ncbi:MAG: acyltransferase [Magnetococcales bacterium]|nr:acyltransferase [Magnetococcales bacterium]
MIQQQYRSFGALRFLLAVLVMVQHFGVNLAPEYVVRVLYPLAVGSNAVLVFFVLSGFIIVEASHFFYQERPVAFLLNRLLRVVPPFVVAISLSIVLHGVCWQVAGTLQSIEGEGLTAAVFALPDLLKNYLSFLPSTKAVGLLPDYSFLPYVWAIRIELLFYGVVFASGLLYRLTRSGVAHGFCLGVAGVGGLAVAGFFLSKAPGYAPYFVFGAALFYVRLGKKKAYGLLLPAIPMMVWHFWHTHIPTGDAPAYAANLPAQMAILVVLLVLTVFLSHYEGQYGQKWDRFLGELSYPLYLNHFVVGILARNLFSRTITCFLIALVASFCLSVVLYYLVDRPLKQIRNKVRRQML